MTLKATVAPSSTPQVFAVIAALAAVCVSASLNFDAAHELGLAHSQARAMTFGVGALVATIFAATMPAIALRHLFNHDPIRVIAATALFVVAVSLSVLSALGASATGRADLASARSVDVSAYTRVSADYARAVAELEATAPARTIAELAPIIGSKRVALRGEPCTADASKSARALCIEIASLETEQARAERRAVIEARVAAVSAALASFKPPRQADPQATALAGLAADLGMTIKADDVSRYLAVATALGFEVFAALGLLAAGSNTTHSLGANPLLPAFVACPSAVAAEPAPVVALAITEAPEPTATPLRPCTKHPEIEAAIIERVASAGGSLKTSQRGLALLIGSSAPVVNRVLAALVAGGVIALTAGPDGSVISFVT